MDALTKNMSFFLWIPYLILSLGLTFVILIFVILMYTHTQQILAWSLLFLGGGLFFTISWASHVKILKFQQKKTMRDISQHVQEEIAERIQAEETKQQLEKALLQGQKLQAIGTLAGGIAHDFNNILYAINGYVEMAREDAPKDSILSKNLEKVLEATRRGQDLVARILVFSRRQHHELKSICIKETIEGILELLKLTIPASVTINFVSNVNQGSILGMPTQIHQVIVNIANNSVDAMDGEGTITITLDRIPPDAAFLANIPNKENTYYYKIDISDTGHGIDQSKIERIFEPFYTTKEVGKGTGLGLSSVHSIMEAHKGSVSVRSQLGKGATFTLLFPEFINKEHTHGEDTVS